MCFPQFKALLELLWCYAFQGLIFFLIFSMFAKSFPLRTFFIQGSKERIAGSEIGWIGRMSKWGHATFGQKLLSTLPQFRAFLSHCILQMHQNFQVKCLIDSLTRRNKFLAKNSFCIEWTNQHCPGIGLHLIFFFGVMVMEDASAGLTAALFFSCRRSISFCHQWRPSKKGLDQLLTILSAQNTHSFMTAFDRSWASKAPISLQLFSFPVTQSKFVSRNFRTHQSSVSYSTVQWQSSKMHSWVFMMFSSVWVVDSCPEWSWSSRNKWSFLKMRKPLIHLCFAHCNLLVSCLKHDNCFGHQFFHQKQNFTTACCFFLQPS